MTLPFPTSNKRTYQCFVCGIMFDTYDEFQNHILEEHEEGRDYIKCPLERCQAPVRDLRLHFKIKHPHEQIPKNSQMKATIWRDFSPKGKKRSKKPKFKEGWYFSTKMNKKIKYRSGYEQTVYECLDRDIEVNGFDAEPFKIPYIHKGNQHDYIPDIIVKFLDGHTEIWEIKPANQTNLPKNQDKWYAANEACKKRGWKFVVITEKGIGKLKRKIQLNEAQN